ncbi:MAG: flagellar hook-length control protein FliK [Myxococcota bacterium]
MIRPTDPTTPPAPGGRTQNTQAPDSPEGFGLLLASLFASDDAPRASGRGPLGEGPGERPPEDGASREGEAGPADEPAGDLALVRLASSDPAAQAPSPLGAERPEGRGRAGRDPDGSPRRAVLPVVSPRSPESGPSEVAPAVRPLPADAAVSPAAVAEGEGAPARAPAPAALPGAPAPEPSQAMGPADESPAPAAAESIKNGAPVERVPGAPGTSVESPVSGTPGVSGATGAPARPADAIALSPAATLAPRSEAGPAGRSRSPASGIQPAASGNSQVAAPAGAPATEAVVPGAASTPLGSETDPTPGPAAAAGLQPAPTSPRAPARDAEPSPGDAIDPASGGEGTAEAELADLEVVEEWLPRSPAGQTPAPAASAPPVDPAAPGFAPVASGVEAARAPASREAPTAPVPVADLPARIDGLAQQGGGSARIRLDPPHLGEIQLEVRIRGDAVVVRMVAREHAARSVLEEGRGMLADGLAARSLRMDRMDVTAAAPAAGDPDVFGGAADSRGGSSDAAPDGSREDPTQTTRGRAAAPPATNPTAPAPGRVQPTLVARDRVDLRI